jgi:DNA-binding phage protein
MNIPKLRGKMVEMGHGVDSLAAKIGVDRSTLYRKFDCGEKFTIGEVQKLIDALALTNDEISAIFFN